MDFLSRAGRCLCVRGFNRDRYQLCYSRSVLGQDWWDKRE